MNRTGLVTDPKNDPRICIGHGVDGDPRDLSTSPETVLGSWAIRSTARDVVQFLVANLNAGGATAYQEWNIPEDLKSALALVCFLFI